MPEQPVAPTGVSLEFQAVAMAFDVLRTVTGSMPDDADGSVALRRACSDHIIAFLQKASVESHVWVPAK